MGLSSRHRAVSLLANVICLVMRDSSWWCCVEPKMELASETATMRAHLGLAICSYRRRAQGLKAFDLDAYLDSVGLWHRVRICAQSRSPKAYRRSMLMEPSNPTLGRLLLAEAALLWPLVATLRIACTLVRRAFKVHPMSCAT
jgi:hypothetical protein